MAFAAFAADLRGARVRIAGVDGFFSRVIAASSGFERRRATGRRRSNITPVLSSPSLSALRVSLPGAGSIFFTCGASARKYRHRQNLYASPGARDARGEIHGLHHQDVRVDRVHDEFRGVPDEESLEA